MECQQVIRLLSEYVDEVLDSQTAEHITEHLASCKACSAELDELRTLVRNINSFSRVAAPQEFLQDVHARLEQPSFSTKLTRMFLHPLHVKVPLELAGLIASLVLVVAIHHSMYPAAKQELASQTLQVPSPAALPQTNPGPALQKDTKEQEMALGKVRENEASEAPKPIVIALALKPPHEDGKKIKGHAAGGLSSGIECSQEFRDEGRKETVASPEMPKNPAAPTRSKGPSDSTGHLSANTTTENKAEPARSETADKALETPAHAPEPPSKEMHKPGAENLASYQGSRQPTRQDGKETISRIQHFIFRAGGSVSSIEYDKTTNMPTSLTAEIPAERYSYLLKSLKKLGTITEPQPSAIPPSSSKPIQLKIEFKP